MRTWTRAVFLTLCGGPCGRHIAEGTPMLVFDIAGLHKVRCAACAGEDVPADLPLTPVHPRPPKLETMQRLGLLPLDREPGQEG